jgi:hypothetical protein
MSAGASKKHADGRITVIRDAGLGHRHRYET